MKLTSSLIALALLASSSPSSSSGEPVVQIAELSIDPAQLPAYERALRTEIETSLRLEPGVLSLQAVQVSSTPTEIRIVEVYADRAAYEAHLQSPHFKTYKTTTASMVTSLKLIPAREMVPSTKEQSMTTTKKEGNAQKAIGDVAPKLAELTDEVLFGDVWERDGLSKRDRSLITVAALVALGKTEQLDFHLPYAVKNGVTTDELVEAITHLAFYAGWPSAMSAINKAKTTVLSSSTDSPKR